MCQSDSVVMCVLRGQDVSCSIITMFPFSVKVSSSHFLKFLLHTQALLTGSNGLAHGSTPKRKEQHKNAERFFCHKAVYHLSTNKAVTRLFKRWFFRLAILLFNQILAFSNKSFSTLVHEN